MATEWYCKIAGHERGPLSSQALKSMAQLGRLQPDSLVRQGTDGSWVPAARVKGLFASGQPAAASQHKPEPDTERTPDADSSAVLIAKPLEEAPRVSAAKIPPKAKPAPPRKAKPLEEPPALPAEVAAGPPVGAVPPVGAIPRAAPAAAATPVPDQFGIVAGGRSVTGRAAGRTVAPPLSGKRKQRKNLMLVGGLLLTIVVLGGIAAAVMMSRGKSGDTANASAEAAAAKNIEEEVIRIDEPDAAKPEKTGAGGTAGASPKGSAGDDAAGADGKWSDAAKSAIKRGDVRVKVVSVEVGRPRLVKPTGRAARPESMALVIKLELSNTNVTKKLKYTSWSDRNLGVTLIDNFDNPYTQKTKKTFGGAMPEGQGTSGSIYPGKAIVDVVVFEPPIDSAKFLRLELPAAAFGESGRLNFQIPISMIDKMVKEGGDEKPTMSGGGVSDEFTKAVNQVDGDRKPGPAGRGVPAIDRAIEEVENEKKPEAAKPAATKKEPDPFAEGAENDKKDDPDGDVSKIMKDIDEIRTEDKKPEK